MERAPAPPKPKKPSKKTPEKKRESNSLFDVFNTLLEGKQKTSTTLATPQTLNRRLMDEKEADDERESEQSSDEEEQSGEQSEEERGRPIVPPRSRARLPPGKARNAERSVSVSSSSVSESEEDEEEGEEGEESDSASSDEDGSMGE